MCVAYRGVELVSTIIHVGGAGLSVCWPSVPVCICACTSLCRRLRRVSLSVVKDGHTLLELENVKKKRPYEKRCLGLRALVEGSRHVKGDCRKEHARHEDATPCSRRFPLDHLLMWKEGVLERSAHGRGDDEINYGGHQVSCHKVG